MVTSFSRPRRGLHLLPPHQLRDLVARYIALQGIIPESYRLALIDEATAILGDRIGGEA